MANSFYWKGQRISLPELSEKEKLCPMDCDQRYQNRCYNFDCDLEEAKIGYYKNWKCMLLYTKTEG